MLVFWTAPLLDKMAEKDKGGCQMKKTKKQFRPILP